MSANNDSPKNTEPNEDQLDGLRGEVDRIDDGILGLLAERREIARKIAAEKQRAQVTTTVRRPCSWSVSPPPASTS